MDGPLTPHILRFSEDPRHLLVLDGIPAAPIHPEGSVVAVSSTEEMLRLPLDETWAVLRPRPAGRETLALLGLARRLILQTRRRKDLMRLLLLHTRSNLSVPWSRRLFASPPELGVAVGAAPSLDRHLGVLRGLQDKAFIVCGLTALRPLLHAGIRPQAVACSDLQVHAVAHLPAVSDIPPGILLLADPGVHPAILRHWAGPVQAVDCGSPFASLLHMPWSARGAADLCLTFLLAADSRTVLLCGFDASRPFDRSHARGTAASLHAINRSHRLRPAFAPSPGLRRRGDAVSGIPLYSDPFLDASAETIRERIDAAPPDVVLLGLDTPVFHPRLRVIDPMDVPVSGKPAVFGDEPDEAARDALETLWKAAARQAREWLAGAPWTDGAFLGLVRWFLPNHDLPAKPTPDHPASRLASLLA